MRCNCESEGSGENGENREGRTVIGSLVTTLEVQYVSVWKKKKRAFSSIHLINDIITCLKKTTIEAIWGYCKVTGLNMVIFFP